MELTQKFLMKMHARKEPPFSYQWSTPSYRFTSTPLASLFLRCDQWCRRGRLGGGAPRYDLMGARPPNSVNFLELKSYMKYYSIIKRYFRFKKLWRNRYITRKGVVKLRCLLDNIIIFLHKYVDLASKFLIKIHTRREPR